MENGRDHVTSRSIVIPVRLPTPDSRLPTPDSRLPTMLNPDTYLDRLYSDESLTDNLTDRQAEQLLAWAAGRLERASSEEEAERIIAALRRINHDAGDGAGFDELFASLERGEPDRDRLA